MPYHCRACAVEWNGYTAGRDCWNCGERGTAGPYVDEHGNTIPWTSREIVTVRETA